MQFNLGRQLIHIPKRILWQTRIKRWGIGYPDPELRYLRKLCSPTKVSIDVGASLGLYTTHLLAHSGWVIAFEPREDAASELRRVFERHSVVIHSVALSDKNGESTMLICESDLGRTTLEPDNPIGGTPQPVTTRTLDSFNLQNVGFIKIDVEGHEESVLRGALQTIDDNRPNLLIEIEDRHNRGSVKRVPQLLQERGYTGWFLLNGKWQSLTMFDPREYQRVDVAPYVNNFVFVPSEKGNVLNA